MKSLFPLACYIRAILFTNGKSQGQKHVVSLYCIMNSTNNKSWYGFTGFLNVFLDCLVIEGKSATGHVLAYRRKDVLGHALTGIARSHTNSRTRFFFNSDHDVIFTCIPFGIGFLLCFTYGHVSHPLTEFRNKYSTTKVSTSTCKKE